MMVERFLFEIIREIYEYRYGDFDKLRFKKSNCLTNFSFWFFGKIKLAFFNLTVKKL